MARFVFIGWILTWWKGIDKFGFEWDKGNEEKNKNKHGISIGEIEETFISKKIFILGLQIFPKFEEERFGIVGITKKEKILTVVFTMRDNRIRVISARPADKKERKLYAKENDIRKVLERV